MFLLHFSRFKTFLFFGHSKIKVRSCVLCVYAGTPLKAVDTFSAQTGSLPFTCRFFSLVAFLIRLYRHSEY